ncbi:unnamed protein product [Protopolystoma xenopodis]|uniref:Uncharacterized protein n=1 Tax=Protopolystoma xenopodis TaxID=117903 RepID=A0A3S4ZP04_9PLAT|nr:unnamed protein product [Protopolystoma xenopodis]
MEAPGTRMICHSSFLRFLYYVISLSILLPTISHLVLANGSTFVNLRKIAIIKPSKPYYRIGENIKGCFLYDEVIETETGELKQVLSLSRLKYEYKVYDFKEQRYSFTSTTQYEGLIPNGLTEFRGDQRIVRVNCIIKDGGAHIRDIPIEGETRKYPFLCLYL